MFPPQEPTKDFPYQIEDKIGEGAMGSVWRAMEPSLGRSVAIKVLRQDMLSTLKPEVAKEAMQRFTQEARAAASLSHPGITTIFRVGSVEETPYIAMEWLEGETLESLIGREAPIPHERAVQLAIEVLEALGQAHKAGVVHRDLKPANLIVLRNGRLKITDFGVAHVEKSDLVSTRANTVLGTPLYASPEQIHGDTIDARSDLYSIGVVLYELVTGELPFSASGIFDLAQQMISAKPPRPSTYNDTLPQDLEAVILRALSRDPQGRYTSAYEMANALSSFLGVANSSGGLTSQLSRSMGLANTVQSSQPVGTTTLVVEGKKRAELVAGAVQTWTPQPFGRQSPHELLERLLERPLHAAAFAGAAKFGDRYFLIYDGLIYAAFNVETGAQGDLVYENLPEEEAATIYPVPDMLRTQTILMLASIVHPSRVRHSKLDTAFVDLNKMATKLREERFSGTIRVSRGNDIGYIILWQGENILNLFSLGWPDEARKKSWRRWINESGAVADVEERRTVLPAFAYRQELRDFAFRIKRGEQAERSNFGVSERADIALVPDATDMSQSRAERGSKTMRNIYRSDPMFSFLCWLLTGLPSYFSERDRQKGWKYLVGWAELVERAQLHTELDRPQSREFDFFDMVTSDGEEKVLHLADHYSRVDAAEISAFVEKVRVAKQARIKTGDIGGAVLIAREFTPAAMEAYAEYIAEPENASLLYNLQNTFNKYEGFVRMGPTRGFHLLLVKESSAGFEPLLP